MSIMLCCKKCNIITYPELKQHPDVGTPTGIECTFSCCGTTVLLSPEDSKEIGRSEKLPRVEPVVSAVEGTDFKSFADYMTHKTDEKPDLYVSGPAGRIVLTQICRLISEDHKRVNGTEYHFGVYKMSYVISHILIHGRAPTDKDFESFCAYWPDGRPCRSMEANLRQIVGKVIGFTMQQDICNRDFRWRINQTKHQI